MSVQVTFTDPLDLERVIAALQRAADAEAADRTYLATRWRAIADDLEDATPAMVAALDPTTGCCPATTAAELERLALQLRQARAGIRGVASAVAIAEHAAGIDS